jgi:hypothetical protein
VSITVVDADDLLDKPEEVIRAYCKEVGLEFTEGMLKWGDEESEARAKEQFEKWNGFHDDAIGSTELKARGHALVSFFLSFWEAKGRGRGRRWRWGREGANRKQKTPTEAEEDQQWREKFGEDAAKVIRETVNANIPDYEYLKGFAIKF